MNTTNTTTIPLRAATLEPQALTVLQHLIAVGSISALEAQGVYRIRSLSRRITDITRAGYEVCKTHKKDATGQRYVRYTIYRPNFSLA